MYETPSHAIAYDAIVLTLAYCTSPLYTMGGSNTECLLVKTAFQPVSIPQMTTG
jgi:hypothetical protein